MRTKPMSELTPHQALERKCDNAVSKWVLKHEHCEACNRWVSQLDPHHIGGRGHAARWDFESIAVVCRRCHRIVQGNDKAEDYAFGELRCKRARVLKNKTEKMTLEELEKKLSEVKSWPRRDA